MHVCGHLPSFAQQTTNSSKSNESEELNNCKLQVISFLDAFFSAHTDVDHVPEEGNVKSVRLNWIRVYDEYKEHCKLILVKVSRIAILRSFFNLRTSIGANIVLISENIGQRVRQDGNIWNVMNVTN